MTGSQAFYPIRCPQRARARRAPIPVSTDVDRPARAGWAALRLLADVALFSGIVVRRFWFGATMELGRSGRSMMMMDAAPDSDQVRGHRQQIGNSAALTDGILSSTRGAFFQPGLRFDRPGLVVRRRCCRRFMQRNDLSVIPVNAERLHLASFAAISAPMPVRSFAALHEV